MRRTRCILPASMLLLLIGLACGRADETQSAERLRDVIYGRKHGTSLTMDAFTPAEPNGVGVILVISGGWFSAHGAINQDFAGPLLDKHFTVFAVVHGSQPKFTIPEIVEDMHRAVRFIRQNAKTYGIDPDRIGICGASAGGHLSLMQATAGNSGDPQANDPIDRQSSRVQAIACFFPPTDFLNYGKEGEIALGTGVLKDFRAPFDFKELDLKTRAFVSITDPRRILDIGREISPINHVSSDDPPTLIVHGDADKLVPIQQAELIVDKLQSVGVEAKLVVKQGAGHGWPNFTGDIDQFANWFHEHLVEAKRSKATSGIDR